MRVKYTAYCLTWSISDLDVPLYVPCWLSERAFLSLGWDKNDETIVEELKLRPENYTVNYVDFKTVD